MSNPYLMLPTFVICPDRSAYEGETMHKVGELEPRGDYYYTFSNQLMRDLVEEYCKRLREAAGDGAVHDFIASLKVTPTAD